MQTVTARRLIPANPGVLWPLIADVTQIAHWHFNIARVDLLTSSATGVGAARCCNFYDGTSVREDVVAVEDGRKVRVELSEFSVPMKHIELEIALRDQSAGDTEAMQATEIEKNSAAQRSCSRFARNDSQSEGHKFKSCPRNQILH